MWNPLLGKRAVDEIHARRANMVTYTEVCMFLQSTMPYHTFLSTLLCVCRLNDHLMFLISSLIVV